jgi:hypothetical protein
MAMPTIRTLVAIMEGTTHKSLSAAGSLLSVYRNNSSG